MRKANTSSHGVKSLSIRRYWGWPIWPSLCKATLHTQLSYRHAKGRALLPLLEQPPDSVATAGEPHFLLEFTRRLPGCRAKRHRECRRAAKTATRGHLLDQQILIG